MGREILKIYDQASYVFSFWKRFLKFDFCLELSEKCKTVYLHFLPLFASFCTFSDSSKIC